MADIKTPFSDAIVKGSIPTKSTGSVSYGSESGDGYPSGDGGIVPTVKRDTHWGGPSKSGAFKTPFSDAV